MKQIGAMIASIIHEPESEEVMVRVKREVAEMTAKFPMYPGRLKENRDEASAPPATAGG